MKTLISIILGLMLVGCSSNPIRVVERADGLSSAPDWASTTNPSFQKDGKTYFVGFVSVDGSVSIGSSLNASDAKALAEPLRSAYSDFLDQNSLGESLQGVAGTRLISTLRSSQVPMPSLRIVHRYWEKIQTEQGEALPQTELRSFSLVEIPTSEYERAKQQTFDSLKKQPEVAKALDEVMKAQRQRALGDSERKPASE